MSLGIAVGGRWIGRELLLGVAIGAGLMWLGGLGRPGAVVFASANESSGGGKLAIARDGLEGTQLLWLVDSPERTLCIYQYDPRKGKLKLAAARHLAADERLLEFNNEEPHVSDIEKLVRSK